MHTSRGGSHCVGGVLRFFAICLVFGREFDFILKSDLFFKEARIMKSSNEASLSNQLIVVVTSRADLCCRLKPYRDLGSSHQPHIECHRYLPRAENLFCGY